MDLPVIRSASMASLSGIAHAFTTRNGGVSEGEYSSLNCGRFSGDRPERIEENHRRVLKALGARRLISLRQVHSARVHTIDPSWNGREMVEGDGMVSTDPGMALGVMGADCAPVLLADPENGVVGAAHAGWKGALSDITGNVIGRMCELGARRESVVAVVGPAIQQSSYEVGREFMDRFIESGGTGCERFFDLSRDSIHFDLPGYVVERLKSQGVRHVDCLPHDTCSMTEEFFSYRRNCKRGETRYGRQVGAICLVGE
ncbi:MAG: peptidoglycan editing factor PgeF [Gammaproteobacteria bacterium]|nr:peptidoglycan editing factor PgeF [Gammaproteobacteria bacterium]MYD76733.1 peptidoglycan editing factor PgeF [Gammaproteobacteria bacterium]MYJ52141.1 peptidoglycan editing factor PgeF [Gammaproteobacteria bacterium]